MKKRFFQSLLVVLSLTIFISCSDEGIGETVETSNILLPLPDIPYKFTRNGETSVDFYEVELLDEALNLIDRRLKTGDITQNWAYKNTLEVYNNGLSHIKPIEQIANSYTESDRNKIKKDIITHIEDTRYLEKKMAKEGTSGNVGLLLGGAETIYVDEQGVALAEKISTMIDGVIFLDKVLNYHLNDTIFTSNQLQAEHERVQIEPGRNYTELEHHWDLAYGYFLNIQSYAEADGIRSLQGVERKVRNAFVSGRLLLEKFQYEMVVEQIKIIRQELSRVMAIRTINLLTGKITMVNYEESPKQAFKYISQSLGLIYSLQFTRKANGELYLNYEQTNELINSLLQERGLWNDKRLLANKETEGALKNVAYKISKIYDIE